MVNKTNHQTHLKVLDIIFWAINYYIVKKNSIQRELFFSGRLKKSKNDNNDHRALLSFNWQRFLSTSKNIIRTQKYMYMI